jgi:hypothetical protein
LEAIREEGYGFKRYRFKTFRWGKSDMAKKELYDLVEYSEYRSKMCSETPIDL